MHERYKDERITKLFSDEEKLRRWQDTELAVMEAYALCGDFPTAYFNDIRQSLTDNPPDVVWWKKRDKEIHHDLNAFIEERLRFIDPMLQSYFHRGITSYDTEESAFVLTLQVAARTVALELDNLFPIIAQKALQYRYTPMWLRTHGQGAEVGSFGKRILGWYQELKVVEKMLEYSRTLLYYSKISGATGNYTSIDPEIERQALEILGLEPFYGATQILPRVLFIPLASALCSLTSVLDKISTDIRLGSRSGPYVLYREPFTKQQKGSSAMPHKKNPITDEQDEGLARMGLGYLLMTVQNIRTWEERAIEQSCVERVAWPDLFHVTLCAIKNITKVLTGLVVYPVNMLRELADSNGCYAATEAQRVLKELVTAHGLSAEDGYRIVQLAAFNLSSAISEGSDLESFEHADRCLEHSRAYLSHPRKITSIRDVIKNAELYVTGELDISHEKVLEWIEVLRKVFSDPENIQKWENVFKIPHLLRNEDTLYQEILKVYP